MVTPIDLVLGRDVALPRHRAGEFFLRGPVPWAWLSHAAVLSGRALAVGVVLWQQAGMRQTRVVRVNLSRMPVAIDRSAASRGLFALERAGLVSVLRRPGRTLLVTILPSP